MKTLNVVIENFLGIGNANVKLNRNGLTLVEGVNNDSTAAISNGAGKSSLFEAIYFCLFGVTRRGLKADDVINEHGTGGCLVRLLLEIAGRHLTITRTRKHGPKKETALKVEYDGDDVTKGTAKDTQAYLEGILGMNAMTFSKAVFFGQGDVKPFASLTDAELKLVFEQALGLSWFSESRAKVSGYLSGIKNQMAQAETEIKLLESNRDLVQTKVESAKQQIQAAKTMASQWRESREKELAELQVVVTNIAAELVTHEKRKIELEAQVKVSQAGLANANDLKAKLDSAVEEVVSALARSDMLVNRYRRDIMTLEKRCEELESMAGTVCGSCLQVVERENVGHAQASIKEKAKACDAEMQVEAESLKGLYAKRNNLKGLGEKLTQKIAGADHDLNTASNELAGINSAVSAKTMQAGTAQARIDALTKELAAGNADHADAEESAKRQLTMILAELDLANDRIKQLTDKTMEASAKLEDVQLLADALGNAGVKSHVFDSITPELNEYANRYLQILEPDLSVEVSTVSKLKSGDYREKFSIAVSNANGSSSLDGSSGGERQKVNLGVALAFNRLMRSMAADDVPLMVLDEPFEALDTGSSDQVIELLGELDAENLYLITHNESVRDLIPGRMIVEKTGGMATVREAA